MYEQRSPENEPAPSPSLAPPLPPPPHLFEATPFPLSGSKTYTYCGLSPETDGYGEIVLCSALVVVHNDEWLFLKLDQLSSFFAALRESGPYRYHLIGYHSFSVKHTDFYKNGHCSVEKCSEDPICFNIKFTDGEHEESYLSGVPEEAILTLLRIEAVLEARFTCLKFRNTEATGVINEAVIKYRHNPSKLREESERWTCDKTLVELAWNQFNIFSTLVREFYNANKNNTAYF